MMVRRRMEGKACVVEVYYVCRMAKIGLAGSFDEVTCTSSGQFFSYFDKCAKIDNRATAAAFQ